MEREGLISVFSPLDTTQIERLKYVQVASCVQREFISVFEFVDTSLKTNNTERSSE